MKNSYFLGSLPSLLACFILIFSPMAQAGFLEKEISFSEAELQSHLNKAKSLHKDIAGLIQIEQVGPSIISLSKQPGRVTLLNSLIITLSGKGNVPVEVISSAGLRYDDHTKSFYLENPTADEIKTEQLPAETLKLIKLGATQAVASYFRNKPVYTLKENGSTQEATARWLLKSIRIDSGKVIATLSPF